MLEELLFFTFSITETMVMIYLAFVLFTFRFKDHLVQSIIMAVLLSIVSYYLRSHSFGVIDVVIQPFLFIIGFRIVCKVDLFHSTMMSFAYLVHNSLQVLIVVMLAWTGLIESFVNSFSYGAHIIQTISVLVTLSLIFFIYKFNFQFSFIPTKLIQPKVDRYGWYLLTLVAFEILGIGYLYYWYTNNFQNYFYVPAFLFIFASFVTLVVLSKKDLSYD